MNTVILLTLYLLLAEQQTSAQKQYLAENLPKMTKNMGCAEKKNVLVKFFPPPLNQGLRTVDQTMADPAYKEALKTYFPECAKEIK